MNFVCANFCTLCRVCVVVSDYDIQNYFAYHAGKALTFGSMMDGNGGAKGVP